MAVFPAIDSAMSWSARSKTANVKGATSPRSGPPCFICARQPRLPSDVGLKEGLFSMGSRQVCRGFWNLEGRKRENDRMELEKLLKENIKG